MKNLIIDKEIRGIQFKLIGGNRSLELCARMNYETENLDFIDQIPKSSVLYDLGACEGRFSVYAASKGINVVSIEPETRNFQILNDNISINLLESKIKPFKYGISDSNGKATLKIGQPWPGGHQKVIDNSSNREDLNFKFIDQEEIETISFENLVFMDANPFPNYLKVDIDGSEVNFIKGAIEILKDSRLKGLIFELDINDNNFNWIINQLKDCGLVESNRFQVPNEPQLFNIIFYRK